MDTTEIIIYVLLVLVLILIAWVIRMELRLKKIFRGKKGKDLEDAIGALSDAVTTAEEKGRALYAHAKKTDARLAKCIRNIETVRFNPFHDSGSNQSFAVALLNDEGDGVVLSSLYSRERMSVFAKPIKQGKAEYELTTEESDVLKKTTS